MITRIVAAGLFLFAFTAHAAARLPLLSLRDQATTTHCWAYASSHFLESRALLRDNQSVVIDVERDTKYWVDYERLWSIYKTKNADIYFGSYEGGWQIEFWDSLLKHGKSVYKTETKAAEVVYREFDPFREHLDFIPGQVYPASTGLPSFEVARAHVANDIRDDVEARSYIVDFLDRYYGKPTATTQWFGKEIATEELAENLLQGDFAAHNTTDDLYLVKPVTDGNYGWVKYLGERFWGYRLDQGRVLALVKHSLDQGFPVTFDNVSHAMTIIAHDEKGGQTMFAVADSGGGMITWYDSAAMLSNLNLLTVFKAAVQDQLPARPVTWMSKGIRYDERDNLLMPPS